MAPLDWEKLMAATPSKLSDDQVDEFYESLVSVSACLGLYLGDKWCGEANLVNWIYMFNQ